MVNHAAREQPRSPINRTPAIGRTLLPSLHCFTPLGHEKELGTATLLNQVCWFLGACIGLCEINDKNHSLRGFQMASSVFSASHTISPSYNGHSVT